MAISSIKHNEENEVNKIHTELPIKSIAISTEIPKENLKNIDVISSTLKFLKLYTSSIKDNISKLNTFFLHDFSKIQQKTTDQIKDVFNKNAEIEKRKEFDSLDDKVKNKKIEVQNEDTNDNKVIKNEESGSGLLSTLFAFSGLKKLKGAISKLGKSAIIGFAKKALKILFKGFLGAFAIFDFIRIFSMSDKELSKITGHEKNTIWNKIGAWAADMISTLTFGLLGDSKQIYQYISQLPDLFMKFIKSIWNFVISSDMVKKMNDGIKYLFNNFSKLYDNFGTWIGNLVNSIGSWISDKITSITDSIINLFPESWKKSLNEIKDFFGKEIIDRFAGIKELFSNAWDTIKAIGEDILNIFGDIKNLFTSGFSKESLKKLWKDLEKYIFDSITGISKLLINVLKSLFGKKRIEKVFQGITLIFDSIKKWVIDAKNKILKIFHLGGDDTERLKQLKEQGIYKDTTGHDEIDFDKLSEAVKSGKISMDDIKLMESNDRSWNNTLSADQKRKLEEYVMSNPEIAKVNKIQESDIVDRESTKENKKNKFNNKKNSDLNAFISDNNSTTPSNISAIDNSNTNNTTVIQKTVTSEPLLGTKKKR